MRDKTVIITGAAGTIGQATAHLLAKEGYGVCLLDQKEKELTDLAKTIPNSRWACLDVTDAKALAEFFGKVGDTLTHVVLAAGMEGYVGPIEDCPEDLFQATMIANVTSVWLGIKNALHLFKPKQLGNIVVLSSLSGLTAMPMLSTYCASKHAVIGLVKTAAREVAHLGIRINAVCAGPVQSAMMQRIDSALIKKYPERLQDGTDASRFIPMQRYATPEEVANMICFLCSEASSYCTGAIMTIDGGVSAGK